MIIGITGKRLSGKNTIAEYLKLKYGFEVLDFTRHVLAPLLKKEKKPITRENLVELAMNLRSEKGTDILVKMLCDKIKPSKNYVIAGVRFREEVDYLRKKFGKEFILISVDAKPKIRYQRALQRSDKGEGSLSFNRFFRAERLPTEAVIPQTMKLADFSIENNSTKTELYKKIDSIMNHIISLQK
ncbi:MAG: hypothetical protein DRP15_03540 [Candidatus Aenigmatarchaeota archaeon]|nr:MAG: hypothetical protein DRP15_03540 [Candidatus Aenigmarchaeota archaeon]